MANASSGLLSLTSQSGFRSEYAVRMPYPQRYLSENETIISEFRPHWTVAAKPVFWFVLALSVGVTLGVLLPDIREWAILAGAVIGVVLLIRPFLTWWFTQHVITTERIIVRQGVLSRSGKEIPLEVINDVAFSQTLFERVFRNGDLLLESAGELGQSRLHDVPHPESIQSVIYQAREARMMALNQSQGSDVQDLDTLARLHASGVLTTDEFEAKKRQILDE